MVIEVDGAAPTAPVSSGGGPRRSWRRGLTLALITGMCLVSAAAGTIVVDRLLNPEPVIEGVADDGPPWGRGNMPLWLQDWAKAKMVVGAPAPDFTLIDNTGKEQVHLASFRGREPVVLIFGSFSCDLLCGALSRIHDLYVAHGDQAQFLFIHVGDAGHAVPALDPLFRQAGVVRVTPENRIRRSQVAMQHFGLTFPCLMDSERQAEYDYDALPQRLVIVDTDGRVALDVGRGVPAGLDLAPVEAWLNEHARARRVQGSAFTDQESGQGDNLIPRAAPSTIGR